MLRLRAMRQRRGLTQQQLADAVRISQSAIASYEKGDRTPTADVLCDIADYLNVDVGYLLERQDEERHENRLPPQWHEPVLRAMDAGLTPRDLLDCVEFLARHRAGAGRTIG